MWFFVSSRTAPLRVINLVGSACKGALAVFLSTRSLPLVEFTSHDQVNNLAFSRFQVNDSESRYFEHNHGPCSVSWPLALLTLATFVILRRSILWPSLIMYLAQVI